MAQKNLFRDILRLITPEEVALLTDSVMGRQKVMLKLIVQEDLGLIPPQDQIQKAPEEIVSVQGEELPNNLAKIIPFEAKPEEQIKPEESLIEEKEVPLEASADEPAAIEVTQEIKEEVSENYVEINEDGSVKFKEEEVIFEEKIDLTEFILTQQEKCKEASHGMKKKEVMELYNKNSTIDLSRERAQRKNPSRKHNDGILINRKQS